MNMLPSETSTSARRVSSVS